MQKLFLAVIICFLMISSTLYSQVGGKGVYSFLNLPITSRSAALGGKVVALDEADPGVVFTNPGLMNSSLHNQLSLSYVAYFADIKYGFLSYYRKYKNFGTFGIGYQHINYGNFTEADETGTITGNFSASDMALNLIYSYTFDSIVTVGVNLKPIYSTLEQYKSFGFCADIGVSYTHREGLFAAGIVARNLGSMIKPYTSNTWESLPFELVAGFSQKLKHAPFRFVFNFQQLQTYNLYYNRVNSNTVVFGDDTANEPSLMQRIANESLSHIILGVEFVPVKNFYLRGGYNFQRRHELRIQEKASTVGFSWGIGIKINRFYLNYSQATYHLVGASNHLSISTDIDDFFVKKNL